MPWISVIGQVRHSRLPRCRASRCTPRLRGLNLEPGFAAFPKAPLRSGGPRLCCFPAPACDCGILSHGRQNNGTSAAGSCVNTTKDGFSGIRGAPPSPGKSDPGIDFPGKAFPGVKTALSSSSSIQNNPVLWTSLSQLPTAGKPFPGRVSLPRGGHRAWPVVSQGVQVGRPRGFIPVGHS